MERLGEDFYEFEDTIKWSDCAVFFLVLFFWWVFAGRILLDFICRKENIFYVLVFIFIVLIVLVTIKN
jgi:hypothetical protein